MIERPGLLINPHIIYLDIPDMYKICLLVGFLGEVRHKFYTQKEDPGIFKCIYCINWLAVVFAMFSPFNIAASFFGERFRAANFLQKPPSPGRQRRPSHNESTTHHNPLDEYGPDSPETWRSLAKSRQWKGYGWKQQKKTTCDGSVGLIV